METLRIEKEGARAEIVLQRPKALHALNRKMLEEMEEALDLLESQSVRGILFRGEGERAFAAGADVSEMVFMGPREAREHSRKGKEVLEKIENHPAVTLACIRGFALGGGMELALSCDLRVASEDATLGLPEITLGVIPGFGGTQRLPRIVGEGRALEYILTGRRIPAREAWTVGLVHRVVPPEKLLEEARNLLSSILAHPPVAVRSAKEAIRRGMRCDLKGGLMIEEDLFALLFATEDQKEGMRAFLEKRPPSFKGS